MDSKNASPAGICLTDEQIKLLHTQRNRTGVGVQALLRGTKPERPNGLDMSVVEKWLRGTVDTAQKDHFDYVLSKWLSLPDKDKRWIRFTDHKKKYIRKLIKDTGMSVNRLFTNRTDAPEGFKKTQINAWFAPSRYRVERVYYDYVVKVCTENRNKGYIPLTDAIRGQLQAEITRTGTAPNVLLRKATRKEKLKVKPHKVSHWLNSHVKRIDRQELEYVLSLYAQVPDIRNTDKQIFGYDDRRRKALSPLVAPINQEDLTLMCQYRELLAILPGHIFKGATDVPEGLSNYLITAWLNGNTKTALPQHIDWVLSRCHELVQEAYLLQKPDAEEE